jgi:CRP/FNR family transcriptional regulator
MATTRHLVLARAAPAVVALVRPPPPRAVGLSRVGAMLQLVAEHVPVQRCMFHAGETAYRAGDPFTHLYVLNSGFFKMVNNSADGRFQLVGLHFRGDWLGFDGIDGGRYGCDAVALDTGEAWAVHYGALLQACAVSPMLLAGLHAEMSRALTRGRETMLSLCTLPVAARVAEFLRHWAYSLALPEQRTEQITLRMTRAEIGNFLGMSLESVSRAMSGLARAKVIRFTGKGRRHIFIPDLGVLAEFIREDAPALS